MFIFSVANIINRDKEWNFLMFNILMDIGGTFTLLSLGKVIHMALKNLKNILK